jgi:glycosyltransferase involved in cell wall biosynthesis
MLWHLFVGGSPGAAVHNLAFVLNEHAKVIVGVERYAHVKAHVESYHLNGRRVLDPLPQETDVRASLLYGRLRARQPAGALAGIGDASSVYGTIADELTVRVPTGRIVVVLGPPPRDAEELEQWKTVARHTRATEEQPHRRRVFVIPWERWLIGEEPWLEALLGFLNLPSSPRLEAEHARIAQQLTPPEARDEFSDDELAMLESWRQVRAEAELTALRSDETPHELPRLDDPPLSDEEAAARDAERAQVLDEYTHSNAEWPELGALRRRFRDDGAMLWSRAVRLRQRGLTAAAKLPDRAFRVSIVNPYGPPDAAERSAIDQLAGALAHLLRVRLLRHAPRTVAGGEVVVAEQFDGSLLGEPEAVLCPAVPDVLDELGIGVGDGVRTVLLLSDAKGLEVIRAHPQHEVFAATGWLASEARRAGARALHVPWGIDRNLARAVRPMHERGITVSAMVRPGPEHDPDGIERVLIAMRERMPPCDVSVFGGIPVDGATDYLHYPGYGRLVKLLTSSAVHLVAAPENGEGTLAALALAAGSAVVTVDTPSAAEFAIDGRTALLAPPGDHDALTGRIVELLEDVELRSRIAREGRNYAQRLFPPWSEVARRIAVMLTDDR